MNRIVFLIVLILIFQCSLMGQEDNSTQEKSNLSYNFGVHFISNVPLNQLNENMSLGWGLGLVGIIDPEEIPVQFGFDAGLFWHDHVSTSLWVYNGFYDEEFNYSTTSNIFTGDIFIRYQHDFNFKIRPYVDGLLGFNRLATWTRLTSSFDSEVDENSSYYNNLETTKREAGDWTYAFGGRIGMQIILTNRDKEKNQIIFDANIGYRKGGFATYLVEKEDYIIYDSPVEAFEEKQSSTDLLSVRAGILFHF